ncbi:MAG: bifunctional serine/threonine-protein kinase/ABC transporter substrate-binding protein [Cyanobacteria bacterium P01_G01_bin.39]
MCLHENNIVGEHYRVIKQLGAGGFGVTYTAYDEQQSPPPIVVLKQIKIIETDSSDAIRDASYLQKLEAEANILRELVEGTENLFIPRVFDCFIEGDYYYIVQEYIEGHDLSQEILPGEPITEEQAISILREILDILKVVHQRNIVHRDIKPANIVRRESDQRLFLIDFGAFTELGTRHTDTLNNAPNVTLTRIMYCNGYSPNEQRWGIRSLNSDIYALGIMLMQGVTGFSLLAICSPNRPPRMDLNNRCRYIWQEYAPQISPKTKKIISRMIEYDYQRDRYQSVTAVLQDINRISWWQKISLWLNNFLTQNNRNTKLIIITLLACLAAIIFNNKYIIPPQANSNNPCSLKLKDGISCGEEILNPSSRDPDRKRAAEAFSKKEYIEALKYFKVAWQDSHDPETLIYLNNALLDVYKIEAETIAIAVPYSYISPTTNKKDKLRGSVITKDFLRGVAQAQTEVNLSLSNFNPEIAEQLNKYSFLSDIYMGHNKGLRVIIADDANKKEKAREIANQIADNKDVIGLIGHYASARTIDTLSIYNRANLAQISYGSTTRSLSNRTGNNFFRVVPTTEEEAAVMENYINNYDLEEKTIAIFYNPGSDYSKDLRKALIDKIEASNNLNVSIPDDYNQFDIADHENFSTKLAMSKINSDTKNEINIFLLLPDGLTSNALAKAIEIIEADNGQRLILGGNPLVNSKVKDIKTDQPANLIVSTPWHSTENLARDFNQQTLDLWNDRVNGNTAMAYDATIAIIEAIKRQDNPTRQGTINELNNPHFSVDGVTGEIRFNTSTDKERNGDRKNFSPKLVRLFKCEDDNHFVSISLDDTQAEDLICQAEF